MCAWLFGGVQIFMLCAYCYNYKGTQLERPKRQLKIVNVFLLWCHAKYCSSSRKQTTYCWFLWDTRQVLLTIGWGLFKGWDFWSLKLTASFSKCCFAHHTGKKASLPSPAERFFKLVKRMNYSAVSMLTAGCLGALIYESGVCMNALIVMLCVHSVWIIENSEALASSGRDYSAGMLGEGL